MIIDQIKIGERWETACDKTPRNRIGRHHVTITHISSDHIMGTCDERRLTWDRFGNPIGKAHTFGKLDSPCICTPLGLERKTTSSGLFFWGGNMKGEDKMTDYQQPFIAGHDVYLNPELQRVEKEKEELIKLRDQFAMAALTAMLTGNVNFNEDEAGNYITTEEEFAACAYRMADAMMEARK